MKKTPAIGPGSGVHNTKPDNSSLDTALEPNRQISKIVALRER